MALFLVDLIMTVLCLVAMLLTWPGCLASCETVVIVPDDNVPTLVKTGDVVGADQDGWYIVSPGLLKKLFDAARDREP